MYIGGYYMSDHQIYAVILAGGIGLRMGNMEKPKQYIELGEKPIIIHTIEKFYINSKFDKVIVLCPTQWINHTEDLIQRFLPHSNNIVVISAGETRNETIMNAIAYIEENLGLDDQTIIVTHDAVRPFVTHRIIEENIKCALQYGACDTVIPSSDTIVMSKDQESIYDIPERKYMYQGQTPQSFKAKLLKELYEKLNDSQKATLTDAAKICIMNQVDVHLVKGEVFNIKITYPFDIEVAKSLLGGK